MNAVAKALVAGVVAASVAAIPVASAKSPRVTAAGKCTGSATSKIKVKSEDGGKLEVEFEVDQNRNGVRWTWGIARNGTTVRSGASITRAPSGSFSVNRLIGNTAGPDKVAFRATSPTGQVCKGSVTF